MSAARGTPSSGRSFETHSIGNSPFKLLLLRSMPTTLRDEGEGTRVKGGGRREGKEMEKGGY